MIKYTEQFKRKAVRFYLSGKLGFKRTAARYEINAPMLRRWVEAYRAHGKDGLRRKIERYSPSFKLSVLQHMWDNALSNNQAAAVFNIRNPSSIGLWERRYQDGGLEALARPSRKLQNDMKAPSTKPDDKPDEQRTREELLKEVEYLRMENEVLKKLQALVQAQKSSATKKRK